MNTGTYSRAERRKLFNQRVRSHGGKCESEYVNNYTPVDIRCARGHVFTIKPKHIDSCWCPICQAAASALKEQAQKEKVLAYIKAKGGRMFGRYRNAKTRITVECEKGHRWTPLPDNLTSKGTWCPFCRSQRPRRRRPKSTGSFPILI